MSFRKPSALQNAEFINLRVPLKTALKGENEIIVSRARKGYERLLVCRSSVGHPSLASPPPPAGETPSVSQARHLPAAGRPRKVRRLDAHCRIQWLAAQNAHGCANQGCKELYGAISSFSLKWVFGGSLIYLYKKRHCQTMMLFLFRTILHF